MHWSYIFLAPTQRIDSQSIDQTDPGWQKEHVGVLTIDV